MRAPLSALKVGLVQPSIDGSTDSLVAITSLLEVKAFGFSKDTDSIEFSRFFNDYHIQRPRHLDCFDEIHQDHTLMESPNNYSRVLNKRGANSRGWKKSQTLN